MPQQQTVSLAFPPFTRMVKILIVVNVAIYFWELMLEVTGQAAGVAALGITFALKPSLVIHGWIWQLLTYSFLHANLFHILFNMLSLWMFGSALEQHWGGRRFLEFYFFSVLGGGLTTVVLAYAGGSVLGLFPDTSTLGASAGVYGLLLAFGWLFGERMIYLFPFPFAIKAKYMVAVLILIATAGALADRGSTANLAHLGGLLFGYLYLKFIPGRGIAFSLSNSYYSLLNSYHRWKRRQASKKFEVYMRDAEKRSPRPEEKDPPRPPNDKTNGSGGWVN